jgi:hypothetical protein
MPESPEERREIEALLPFYANGSLASDERARVEAALEEDEGLRAELQFLVSLRRSIKHNAEAQAQSSGELGERRLLRRIRQERRRDLVQRAWRPALALAAGLAILAQTFVIGSLQDELHGRQLLGTRQGDIQIRFTPEAQEADIRALLLDADAQIVDGPSTIGLYHLDLEGLEVSRPEHRSEIERVVAVLRARSDLVEHAAAELGE